jgi:hypothetical protein
MKSALARIGYRNVLAILAVQNVVKEGAKPRNGKAL